MNGKGIVLRDRVLGNTIGTKRQFVARVGQLVLSKIDARNGAFGVLPDKCDNAIITGNFWAYEINSARVSTPFLECLTRTAMFLDFCIRASEGTTNRQYLQEAKFLAQEIPLPPLPKQQRIVARIEQLAGKIEAAQELRKQQEQEMSHMLLGAFWSVAKDAPRYRMCEVAPQVRRPVQVDANGSYPELGIRSFGRGTFHKAALSGFDVGNKRVFWIKPGDLLFSNVFAWEGAIAVAKPVDKDRVGSHRYITCMPKKDITTASFLCFYFLTNEGLELIRGASPGGAGRNRTLGLAALNEIQVPIPSLADQLWFDELQSNMDRLKLLQRETNAELDALLPSVLDKAFKGEM